VYFVFFFHSVIVVRVVCNVCVFYSLCPPGEDKGQALGAKRYSLPSKQKHESAAAGDAHAQLHATATAPVPTRYADPHDAPVPSAAGASGCAGTSSNLIDSQTCE
jgi:hypothetical protein